jgi:hypothetical protein
MSGDDRIRGEGFIDTTPRPRDSLVASLQELAQNWQSSTENSRNITVVNGLLPEPMHRNDLTAEGAENAEGENTEMNNSDATGFDMTDASEEWTTEKVEVVVKKSGV